MRTGFSNACGKFSRSLPYDQVGKSLHEAKMDGNKATSVTI
jgi:hypothetical protein